jgi:molybdenum cofactor guanylyltransferase
MILGVILAGGLSRRMGGGDKPLKMLGGETLLSRVIARAKPQCDALILNANGDAARFAEFGLPVVEDSVQGFVGPLAGVLAGMDYALLHGYDHVFSFPADTPFFPTNLVKACGEGLVSVSSGGWTHPIIGLWNVSLRDALHAALTGGERKIDRFTDAHGCRYIDFQVTPFDPFFNCNSPEELLAAEQILPLLKP